MPCFGARYFFADRYNKLAYYTTEATAQTMIDTNTLNDLTQKLSSLLPADIGILKQDLEKNIRATLQSAFQKLDLVTREEFDVQAELLVRTREKLDALEKKMSELE